MNKKYSILCVDDEPEILEAYHDVLSELNWNIIVCENAKEALSLIKKNKQNLAMIISDFKMPEMNGFEFRSELLPEFQNIPFLMLTGFSNKEMALQGMELSISAFLSKPINEQELIESVKKFTVSRLLEIDDEVEMVKGFVDESSPMLEEIESCILELEESPDDKEVINTYFRLLHTIKGTSACVGLSGISHFTHLYEDFVSLLKTNELKVTSEVINILLKGLDALNKLYSMISTRYSDVDPGDLVEIFSIDLEKLKKGGADTDGGAQKEREESSDESVKEEKIYVSMPLLDEFMEISGEFTVIRNTIIKAAKSIEKKYVGDRDVETLGDSLGELHKISSLLQNHISELRKMPVANLFRPLKRVVRDVSKSLGKRVALKTKGDNLRVDSLVSKALSNSLVHIIRNSLDHGIETPEVRRSRGKEEEGKIEVVVKEEGELIEIIIQDDGGGIDPERVKLKALEKGLFSEDELSKMSEQKVFSLILEPGFSTAATVTDISGRGVGMDMVKNSVEGIRGKIKINSILHKGTSFILEIPVPKSVLIISSLLVKVEGQTFVLSIEDVAEVVHVKEKDVARQINDINGSRILRHHGVLIPMLDLRKALSMTCELNSSKDINIVVLRSNNMLYGLVVDEILDIEEVVVKPLSRSLKDLSFYMGSTLIGDGETGLIIDPSGLARHCQISESGSDEAEEIYEKKANVEEEHEYMLFDLGLGAENIFALPLTRVNRLEKFSSKKVEFSGNTPLVRYRGGTLPLVHLAEAVKLKSDNFEDFSSKREALDVLVVEFQERLFGLVVSEIRDIGVTTSPVDELHSTLIGVTGSVYLDGKTITLIDPDRVIKSMPFFDKKINLKAS